MSHNFYMRPSVVLISFLLVQALWAFISFTAPFRTPIVGRLNEIRFQMAAIIEPQTKLLCTTGGIYEEPFLPKVTKRFKSLPFSLIFQGSKKVIMRRRPPNQIHRRLRQLTLGADGLIHPRKDYYERMLLSSNGVDLDRLGLHSRCFYLEATDPKMPITLIPANTTMPDGLCIVFKQCREYCIETDRVCSLEEFNKRLKLLTPSLVEMSQTEFIKLNDKYWEDMKNLPPVKSKGLYVFHDNR